MPSLGFGVFQIRDFDECLRVVSDTLDVGYRLIYTALAQGNEKALVDAIAQFYGVWENKVW